jgi:hypothetical protein
MSAIDYSFENMFYVIYILAQQRAKITHAIL